MLEGMGRDQMRAGDADRERVVERLRTALEEGRLELHEYDERLQGAYSAKTYGDLDALLTDLPLAAPLVPTGAAPVERAGNPTGEWLVHVWQGLVPAALVLTLIWAIGGMGDYWPIWVVGPWGLLLIWQTISACCPGRPGGGSRSGRPRRSRSARPRNASRNASGRRKALEEERIARGIPAVQEKKDHVSDSPEATHPTTGSGDLGLVSIAVARTLASWRAASTLACLQRFEGRREPRLVRPSSEDRMWRCTSASPKPRCQVAEDMPKKDGAIEIEGRVVEPLPNAMFRVELANGHGCWPTSAARCVSTTSASFPRTGSWSSSRRTT